MTKFEEIKDKLTNSKVLCVIMLAAFIVIGAFLAYNQSQKTTGKFMAKHFYTIPMETYSIEKINTKTDEVLSCRELNKEEVTDIAHYIQKADFKKTKEITPSSDEGFIFSGKDKNGGYIFFLKSYGNEFCEGYMVYPDGNHANVEFKFSIISKNWEETFNKFI